MGFKAQVLRATVARADRPVPVEGWPMRSNNLIGIPNCREVEKERRHSSRQKEPERVCPAGDCGEAGRDKVGIVKNGTLDQRYPVLTLGVRAVWLNRYRGASSANSPVATTGKGTRPHPSPLNCAASGVILEQTSKRVVRHGGNVATLHPPPPPFPPLPQELADMTCGAKPAAGTPCKRRDLYRSGRCGLAWRTQHRPAQVSGKHGGKH